MQQDTTKPPARKPSLIDYARAWGESPFPPTLLATLIAAQHMRPFQPLPMIFPPALLFTTYVSLLDYKVDAAGISAAWSGLYLLLAARRKQTLRNKWSLRGVVRGSAMGLGFVNLVGGGLVYGFGMRKNNGEGEEV
ncbi:hypothetical protein AJ80_00747 [Polytolypa hystricis UAMH7299]|uniref:Altered inheritance of mitochondria protein 19 n=1 Tax=Polytolypa hystricis (strain UAMH7299) TaxID=1447883 RepID=A0A2B7Z0P8_POLH7|nr:hypothetical protein AJ80_00747 [Polytolypa hystricis UAMH7299]